MGVILRSRNRCTVLKTRGINVYCSLRGIVEYFGDECTSALNNLTDAGKDSQRCQEKNTNSLFSFVGGLEGQVNFKRSDEEPMNYKRPLRQGQE